MGYLKHKTRLNHETLTLMAANDVIKARLIGRYRKTYPTIMHWIKENNPILTTVDSLEIIKTELDLSQSEVIENY